MARIAERPGFTTMSLYRHVKSRNDVLARTRGSCTCPSPGRR
ncbi:hypothetical protein [Amycolatopsis sp. NBRC 101858]